LCSNPIYPYVRHSLLTQLDTPLGERLHGQRPNNRLRAPPRPLAPLDRPRRDLCLEFLMQVLLRNHSILLFTLRYGPLLDILLLRCGWLVFLLLVVEEALGHLLLNEFHILFVSFVVSIGAPRQQVTHIR